MTARKVIREHLPYLMGLGIFESCVEVIRSAGGQEEPKAAKGSSQGIIPKSSSPGMSAFMSSLAPSERIKCHA